LRHLFEASHDSGSYEISGGPEIAAKEYERLRYMGGQEVG
jgi:hypothetical protein